MAIKKVLTNDGWVIQEDVATAAAQKEEVKDNVGTREERPEDTRTRGSGKRYKDK